VPKGSGYDRYNGAKVSDLSTAEFRQAYSCCKLVSPLVRAGERGNLSLFR
jgi:hypothetical protein